MRFFYSIMPLSASAVVLIFLICSNVQFCKAYLFWNQSTISTHQTFMQFSTPEECARECKDNEPSKYCYYHFVLEYYTSNNRACDYCEQPVNNSGITSSCECVIGDGFEKTIFSINRMIPGPSIQVCKNDYVIIDLQNEAEGLEASIHWHGIFQNGFQYFDGVPFLTQCPILSSNTFRYQFMVKNSGTHFYHSHISVHMIDGQYGSFIVRDPPQLNPFHNLYDMDLPEHVIVISDWMHELSLERFPGRYKTNSKGQIPQNFLINGRGNWKNPSSGVSTNVALSMFMVEKGKRYRFRMINACSTVCLIEVKIENHSLQIIATDGENVKPVQGINAITMATGERVDVILNANQTSGYYWIHVRGLGECAEKEIYQLAILAYKDSSKSSLSSYPGYFFGASRSVFNPPNATECENGLCVDQLTKIYLPDEHVTPLYQKPDELIIMSFNFFNYSEPFLFNSKNQEYQRFFVSPTGSHIDSLVANISYKNPSAPLISQNNGYQFMCGDPFVPSTCTEPCTCAHVSHIQLGALVDVMIYDESWWFFHCHFTWHTATGMNVVLHIGTSYDLPPVPPNFPKCNNWTPRI
ncbi:uncharacterized protein LOC126851972 isoform X3 [Cataglyphis hispanica]|uniref:uncharacterized protein LOC126851972 isoform X3 n=1 Tax=Cataglyphis hispanica TaxID=1086592 RepID=UPI0021803E39|nr:uncharacterized protein LOC126851972 isoform X3 [Cataglyphis hispanica]